jgi:hypothetical protein
LLEHLALPEAAREQVLQATPTIGSAAHWLANKSVKRAASADLPLYKFSLCLPERLANEAEHACTTLLWHNVDLIMVVVVDAPFGLPRPNRPVALAP